MAVTLPSISDAEQAKVSLVTLFIAVPLMSAGCGLAREFSYGPARRASCEPGAKGQRYSAAVRRIVPLILVLLTTGAGSTGRAQIACDRQCLTDTMTRYLSALAAHDPAAAPLAPNARFTEDGIPLKVGEGLWKSPIKFGSYRLDFIDTRQGAAAVHMVLEENGMPVLFAARLKVVDRTITEIETIVVRSQAESMLFAPASLTAPSAGMTYQPTPSERMSRDQMVAVAERYPAGLRAGSFAAVDARFAPDAYRFENGVRMAGPGCTFQPPSCENMGAQRIPTLPDVKQRVLAVDEDAGVVLFWLAFGRGSLPGAAFEGKGLVTFEAFKVYGGTIHAAEAVFKGLPLNASSGWD